MHRIMGSRLLDIDRLDAVRRAGASPRSALDRIAEAIRTSLAVPVALVSLVDANYQYLPGAAGLSEPLQSQRETPMSHSFCRHVVVEGGPLAVENTRRDARTRGNPAVDDFSVAAYAGWPLLTGDGLTLGSLCAMDTVPREWTWRDLLCLEVMAGTTMEVIEATTSIGHRSTRSRPHADPARPAEMHAQP